MTITDSDGDQVVFRRLTTDERPDAVTVISVRLVTTMSNCVTVTEAQTLALIDFLLASLLEPRPCA